MKRIACLAALGIAAALSAGANLSASAKPIDFDLPPETAAFKPGPNLEVVQGNCGACHSADYIATQPIGPKFKKDFWTAEVTKMIKVYGAPIDEKEAPQIIDYLVATY
jgi:mono/diheme cytochrome c family protein